MPKRNRSHEDQDASQSSPNESLLHNNLTLQGWCQKLSDTFARLDGLEAKTEDLGAKYDNYRHEKEECERLLLLLKENHKDDNEKKKKKLLEQRLRDAEAGIRDVEARLVECERRSVVAEGELREIKDVIREVFGIDPYRRIGV